MTTLRDQIRDMMIEYHKQINDQYDDNNPDPIRTPEEIQEELLDNFFEEQSK